MHNAHINDKNFFIQDIFERPSEFYLIITLQEAELLFTIYVPVANCEASIVQ